MPIERKIVSRYPSHTCATHRSVTPLPIPD